MLCLSQAVPNVSQFPNNSPVHEWFKKILALKIKIVAKSRNLSRENSIQRYRKAYGIRCTDFSFPDQYVPWTFRLLSYMSVPLVRVCLWWFPYTYQSLLGDPIEKRRAKLAYILYMEPLVIGF